jgi:endogenous inhibitor of DNA gyrase (YacG/DUF329 family)
VARIQGERQMVCPTCGTLLVGATREPTLRERGCPECGRPLVTGPNSDAEKKEMRTGGPLWDNALDGPSLKTVSAPLLLQQLRRAAGLRALITLGSEIVAIFLISIILTATGIEHERVASAAFFLCVFGVPLLVCWIWTVKVCRTSVTCPSCGSGRAASRATNAYAVRATDIALTHLRIMNSGD